MNKKNKIKYLSFINIIIVSIFLFSNIFLTEIRAFGGVMVIDEEVRENTSKIKIDTGKIDTNTDRISKLLAGEIDKGAEYFRLQAAQKQPEVKQLLRDVTDQTITFIDEQGLIIDNPARYLENIKATTTAKFLEDESLQEVCGGASSTEKITQIITENSARTFEKRITCSMKGDQAEAMKKGDFEGAGGWDGLLNYALNPQNNPIGTSILVQMELDRRIEADLEAAKLEANWGSGILSIKECNPDEADPDANFDGCIIVTPGSVVANRLNQADTTNIRQLETATEYNDLTYILANKAVYESEGATDERGIAATISSNTEGDYDFDDILEDIQDIADLPTDNPVDISNIPSLGDIINIGIDLNLNLDFGAKTEEVIKVINTPTTNTTRKLNQAEILKGLIYEQIGIEAMYYNAQSNIYKLLASTSEAFMTCTNPRCDPNTKISIKNAIDGAIGTNNLGLTWNISNIETEYKITTDNITKLTIISTLINTNINIAIQELESLQETQTLHDGTDIIKYSSGGEEYIKIQNWVKNIFSTNRINCPINIRPFSIWGI